MSKKEEEKEVKKVRKGIFKGGLLSILVIASLIMPLSLLFPGNTVKSDDGNISACACRGAPWSQYVCTFFYPWYGHYRHWDAGIHNPPDTWAANYLPDPQPEIFDPASELYDSNDDTIILWQLDSMKRAGIRVAISSWWGIDTYEDRAFKKIITDVMDRPDNPYRDLKWCIYYEEEGYGDPSVEEICDDLNYVANNYGSLPFYFKIDGKIAVFVYGGEGPEGARRWKEVRDNLGNVYIVLKVFGGYYPDYAGFVDSWHQYGPAIRYESQMDYSAFVSPGFWCCHKSPRLTRDLNEFESAVENLLLKSGCKFLLIQTWNEWHEGTQIEPGQLINHEDWNPPFTPAENSYGYEFIDALARHAYSLMPQPVTIEYVSPLDGAVVRKSGINVEIKVKDNYSENLDVYISLDGEPFQQMEFTGSDDLGYLRFKKYVENLSDGNHYTIVYTKNEFDYFSHNARIDFSSARSAPSGREWSLIAGIITVGGLLSIVVALYMGRR
jgi:glycoprotein endo-alpha-1,2-mannosidase